MSNVSSDDDVQKWHRYFAAESNNRGWDLTVNEGRSEAETGEMLDAAHTAAWHWNAVGIELNCMRAMMLLAEVHACAGRGEAAIGYAASMRDFFVHHADTPDWELALAHAITAHAAAIAGDADEHARSYAKAVEAMGLIVDSADREIVEATFRHVPPPRG